MVDFTPPEYISLLFTDVGILTPAAVSQELGNGFVLMKIVKHFA
jgi:translation initiation factor 2B subunit (eIF-2B alpha/beta/delta family)